VGKTTTVINLAAAARRAGRRVLTIDANPQAHLSRHVGAHPEAVGLSALLRAAAAMQLDEEMLRAVVDQPRNGVVDCGDLIPAESTLDDDAAVLLNVSGREQLLREALAPIRDDYDLALIDTAPGFDLIATNAWVAADEILVPCPPEIYALEGLAKLARHLAEVRHRLNPDLRVLGILLTLAELHTVDARATADALRAGAPWPVFDQVVAKRVAYRQAASQRVSVDALDDHLRHVWDLVCDEVLAPVREVLHV
jgi:chromosome partitioning protein